MNTYLSPGDYLPHDAPMILLEQVQHVSAEHAQCLVSVSPEGVLAPFLDAAGNLPGWYALELMAQTVGVWSGWHRRQQGAAHCSLGMILGARELVCSAGVLPAGARLEVQVNLLMQDERVGSFEGEIRQGSTVLATGRVNTFQPDEQELQSLFKQGSSL